MLDWESIGKAHDRAAAWVDAKSWRTLAFLALLCLIVFLAIRS